MLGHIFLSQSAFGRLLKLRILGELRPVDEPQTVAGKPCYLDGLEFTSIEFDQPDLDQSPRPAAFTLNNLVAGETLVGPVATLPFEFSPVRAKVNGRVLFVSTDDVKAASALEANGRFGLPARTSQGFVNVELDMFFSVSPQGAPTLNVRMHAPDAPKFVQDLGNLSVPMAMDAAFAEALEPNRTRVLNAGIAMSGGNIVMRFEFEPVMQGAATEMRRIAEWQSFFRGEYPSQLDTPARDWAIELPTGQLVAKAARELDESMSSGDLKKHFTSTQKAWGQWHSNEAAFTLHKNGVFESLCSGLDVKAEFRTKIQLTVPASNTLRQSVELEIDVDDVDSWKCIGISLLNPLAGLITVFDHSDDLPWYAEIAGSLIWYWPAIAMVGWGAGLDDVATMLVIKEAQKKAKQDKPQIIRTSMSSFYSDTSKAITTPLTRDWLVLENVGAVGNRLVLRGSYQQPDLDTLPRLVGTLTDFFEDWYRKDRCSSVSKWVNAAAVALTLEDVGGTTMSIPIVPVRYGGDIETINGVPTEVGQVTWRVVADPDHAYQYPTALITWSGIPGTFEVELRKSSLPDLGPTVAAVALMPKPMRLQFFTNYGVREFAIPAPPPVPVLTPDEAQIEALERVNECYIFSTLLTRVKALQVFWLPTPQPGLEEAQHWQVLVHGLGEGRRLRAWDADTGELLADVNTLARLTELSLVVAEPQTVRALQLTLDDTSLMNAATYFRKAAGVRGREAVGATPVLVRQTPLYRAGAIGLSAPANLLSAERDACQLRLVALGGTTGSTIAIDLRNPFNHSIRALENPVSPPGTELRQANRPYRCTPVERGVMVEGPNGPRDTHSPGRYFARPWYDRGDVADRYFARLSEDGLTIELFQRGLTREAWPEMGRTSETAPPARGEATKVTRSARKPAQST